MVHDGDASVGRDQPGCPPHARHPSQLAQCTRRHTHATRVTAPTGTASNGYATYKPSIRWPMTLSVHSLHRCGIGQGTADTAGARSRHLCPDFLCHPDFASAPSEVDRTKVGVPRYPSPESGTALSAGWAHSHLSASSVSTATERTHCLLGSAIRRRRPSAVALRVPMVSPGAAVRTPHGSPRGDVTNR